MAVALALSANASAHDETARQTLEPRPQSQTEARARLDEGMSPHAMRGYHRERSIPDIAETLAANAGFIWPVMLRAGVNYRIYGACDSKCDDLDLEIYGADGRLVDADTARDATPYVQITPAASGVHYVRFWIYACDQEPCSAAVRVLSGGEPAPRAHAQADSDSASFLEVVKSELDDAGQTQTANGYMEFGHDVIGPATLEGDGKRESYMLEAGRAYVFTGACDQDCNDADMEILDAEGQQVASDVAPDDRPVVGITPPRAGQYTVRIWLSNCSQQPCYVGFRSFRRPSDYHPPGWAPNHDPNHAPATEPSPPAPPHTPRTRTR
jgi:hypothetical protein